MPFVYICMKRQFAVDGSLLNLEKKGLNSGGDGGGF
jgi:hypothetical protein